MQKLWGVRQAKYKEVSRNRETAITAIVDNVIKVVYKVSIGVVVPALIIGCDRQCLCG
jgi:hypothetical protein